MKTFKLIIDDENKVFINDEDDTSVEDPKKLLNTICLQQEYENILDFLKRDEELMNSDDTVEAIAEIAKNYQIEMHQLLEVNHFMILRLALAATAEEMAG